MRFSFVVFILALTVSAYYPVILLHGFTAGGSTMTLLAETIERLHPGQKAFPLYVHDFNQSFVGLWDQIYDVHDKILETIAKDPELFKDGYHLLGMSMGNLLLRAVLEMWPMNVVNYVSLAGALNGLYMCHDPVVCEAETELLYKPETQKILSVANMWKTPQDQHERYLDNNIFIPFFDNERNFNASLKENFLRIKKLYLFGSDGDEVISPWDASLFNFLQTFNVSLPMEKQGIYANDTFGLQTLDKEGRMIRTPVPGLKHCDWTDIPEVQEKYVMDALP